ncbi:AAA domain-containing protein [Bordetella sp. FB-8]|uniref:AAA domain-containing protein n=1 Tax=Bordetella sp. FB-8 TaxID=1159870 RepID=UPI0012DC4FBB|nr:AAA domain-containing protein [Bordetella sp. FB-8]
MKYWHQCLIADDVSGMARVDIRIAVSEPGKLKWSNFNLGYGPRAGEALRVLIARADKADSPRSQALPVAPSDMADSDDETEASDADDEDELDDEPEFVGDLLSMALVFHHTDNQSFRTIWPSEVVADQKKKQAPDLDIVFWFPFDLDKQGHVFPPRDAEDQWPRVVRQWLDPQPASERKELPDPIGHLESYRQTLGTFFAAADRDASFDGYIDGCCRVFEALQSSAADAGYRRAQGHWVAIPRTLGFAVRALSSVYEAMPADRPLGALEQLLGNGGPSLASDVSVPLSEDTSRRHIAMVDKGAKAERPDLERSADPLNDSQRRAVHALIELRNEPGVISVSGPPGTGKTAMLRAMIANQWVTAAYEGRDSCPVTLVCGATNQSVENVMGTFDGAVGEKNALSKRWLRGFGRQRLGLTASLPSGRKRDNHRKRFAIMVTRRNGTIQVGGVGASRTYARKRHLPAAALHWASEFANALQHVDALRAMFTDAQRTEVERGVKALVSIAKAVGQWSKQCKYRDLPTGAVTDKVLGDTVSLLSGLVSILHEGLRMAVHTQAQARDALLLEPGMDLEARFPSVGGSSKWIAALCEDLAQSASSDERRLGAEKMLDVVLRPTAFHLAARYWEVRWLIGLASPEAGRQAELRRLAMLFPCMVSTLHSAPRLLKDGDSPMFGFADLLIVDEAGQAAPELGAAVLSLAHQAAVVGDMKQLAPISSVTQELDKRQIDDRWGGDAVLDVWKRRGADAATGSVMKLAATGASRSECAPDGTVRDGLLLREHYRCARSIINVCIDLLYHDHDRDAKGNVVARELVPMIGDPLAGALSDADLAIFDDESHEGVLRERMKRSYPLPPLAFYQTGGPNDEPVKGDSWSNQGEVDAIVQWLATTGRQLCKWIARSEGRVGQFEDLASVVAIVTPFRGQAQAIREAIEKALDADWSLAGKPDLSKRMTIGTVHTLQGAEKPVVLFSAVNKDSRATRRAPDNYRERVFIDRDDGRLLNVAISRAQKSFILFGHTDLFFSQEALHPENDLPSAIVGRCLAGVREPEREARTGACRAPATKLGPTQLMVVESTHKAKIIQALMPLQMQVFGSGGHIRDLRGPGAVRWEEGLLPRWHLSERDVQNDVQGLLRRTASRLLQCEELVLGTDNDAQGEAIAWHILDVLRTAPWFAHVKRIRRVRFDALTAPALTSALAVATVVELTGDTPQARLHSACAALNMGVAYGALATRVLDNLIGSVYARHDVPGGGRVKGPLLRALAGEGDERDAPGGCYGLDIHLRMKQIPQSVPARLVVSRAAGAWRPWGTASREDAERSIELLRQARLSTHACLVSEDIVSVPSDAAIGTNAVLREAFRRLGLMPWETMAALQALYEHLPAASVSQQGADAPRSRLAAGAWALVDEAGVIQLTQEGVVQAGKVLRDPWLSTISSGALLNAFDHALSLLAQQRSASVDDYTAFVSHWARRFDDAPSAASVQAPAGPTLHASGCELDLFAGLPHVARPAWRSCSAHPAVNDRGANFETLGGELAPADPAAGEDAGARDGAHGALTPLDMRLSAQSELMARFSPRQREVYAMLRDMTLASVVRDGEVRLLRQVFPLEGIDIGSGGVQWGVEIVAAAEVTYRGWFDADPAGWECVARQWGGAGVGARLSDGYVNGVLRVDPHVRTRSLSTPTVDRLLDWMEARGLGRPSTFSAHIEALLNGVPRVAQVSSEAELETAP